ncbi:class I SAM-dependent methyltransferase [Oceanobacillus piezotolerans]|uniref:Class I SAM-dependent methyltransferase n=1 Tax=Oceanobacillus piezotolerans TaxID=2448030 RepID=A0A498DAL1_9BACI|nr:class I SAM-dependent methyltransferase [Oceanobacillus piezotolerans]RLL48021.1 class I SAM-dependent methyltransferase [Oceanobacillus piezotolerans]
MAYQQMAYLYDKLMSDAPYDEWVEFTLQLLGNRNVRYIADLGCGTGEISLRLKKAGFEVVGIDNSSDMLTYAEHKARNENVPIQWLHQDLRELSGINGIDVAVSYCDVINYITEEQDIREVFNKTYEMLTSEGIFIFDIHALSHVESHYVNQTFADVLEDAAYIWYCTEGEAQGEMYHDLTFFALDDGKYNRFDEYHHQRTYPIPFYKKLLQDTGFQNIKVFADFSLKQNNLSEDNKRIFFFAEKSKG